MSDREQQATYTAEHELTAVLDRTTPESTLITVSAFGSRMTLPAPRRFADITSIQRYVDAVLDMPQVRSLNTGGRISVRVRKGNTRAHYEPWSSVIAIPDTRWAMNEIVVLHEIAHHLDPKYGHGPTFRGHLVHLAEVVIAPEVAFYLRATFHESGLHVQLP